MAECLYMQYIELSKKDYENAFNLQEPVKETVLALLSLSEACRLSEMFEISKDDITEIERYIF